MILRIVMLVASVALGAEPLVTSFARFHESKPTSEGGRLLYNELGCVNCHGGTTNLPPLRGPVLATVTQRIRSEWLRRFIGDPASIHAGAIMPQLIEKSDDSKTIAIEHYLASLRPKVSVRPSDIRHVNAQRGRQLYHTLGCVACHNPGKDFVTSEGVSQPSDFSHRSIDLEDLKLKYNLNSLSAFIFDPLKIRADGRMPKLAMERQDAIDIAGYLMAFDGSDGRLDTPIKSQVPEELLVKEGRKEVIAARCAACHDLPKEVAASHVPLKKFDGGCLELDLHRGPRYTLSEPQRLALKLFLKQKDEILSPQKTVELTLQILNCVACHERDGIGGPDIARRAYFVGDSNLGDTGRYPPPLTGIGGKLRPEWLAKVLKGENRVRHYLNTKMPEYGAAIERLGPLLSVVDARPARSFEGGDDSAGRKLMGTQGGAGCITCHSWGDRHSLGIQGPDLSNIAARLQESWLREYLINPASYRPGTLMPSFWPDGKSFNLNILGGDTERQIASIFKFVESANGEPEGFPMNRNGEFEIVPKDRPVVQRTFMEGVGVRAILVGFSTGVHLAYDGEHGGPSLAWKGRFFDAYRTWFSRFPIFEKPLGDTVAKWPKPNGRFLGYHLDPLGNPTFITEQQGVRVEETFEGMEHGLRRTVTWVPKADFDPTIYHPIQCEPSDAKIEPGRRIFTYLWP